MSDVQEKSIIAKKKILVDTRIFSEKIENCLKFKTRQNPRDRSPDYLRHTEKLALPL
jgi:hypothetical protein